MLVLPGFAVLPGLVLPSGACALGSAPPLVTVVSAGTAVVPGLSAESVPPPSAGRVVAEVVVSVIVGESPLPAGVAGAWTAAVTWRSITRSLTITRSAGALKAAE